MTTYEQLEKEMKGANAFIYGENFPSILSERMISQAIARANDDDPKPELILGFYPWDLSVEGTDFWSDIRKLYTLYPEPTISQIKRIFTFHEVEI